MPKYNNYTNHTYTRPLKNSLEPERSSSLPNSQLELIYHIEESSPNSPGVVS
jgi:hypothetical protein